MHNLFVTMFLQLLFVRFDLIIQLLVDDSLSLIHFLVKLTQLVQYILIIVLLLRLFKLACNMMVLYLFVVKIPQSHLFLYPLDLPLLLFSLKLHLVVKCHRIPDTDFRLESNSLRRR